MMERMSQVLAQPSLAPATPLTGVSNRVLSVDVLRGLTIALMILVNDPGDWSHTYTQLDHAAWNGFTLTDLVFPNFLFMVGASIIFSLQSRIARGESKRILALHILRRSATIFALDLFFGLYPHFHYTHLRIFGVLTRIAVCYLVAGLICLATQRVRTLVAITAALLLGYWALLRFVPITGIGTPTHDVPLLDPDRNLAAWLDRRLFMGHLFDKTRDPEGLLSTIPAVATTLIGVLTGYWLRSQKSPGTKAIRMLWVGILGLVAGEVWNLWFPINKNLWTSSFVLFSGGFALVFLAFLYWVLEIKQWRGAWTMPILVFGMNGIAGFVADSFVYGPSYSFTVKGPNGPVAWHDAAQAKLVSLGASAANASLIYSFVALLFCWILLWFLWRKRIFLKV